MSYRSVLASLAMSSVLTSSLGVAPAALAAYISEVPCATVVRDGTIQELGSGSFTLLWSGQYLTVEAGSATITMLYGEPASFGSLSVGDQVRVTGSLCSSSISATSVQDFSIYTSNVETVGTLISPFPIYTSNHIVLFRNISNWDVYTLGSPTYVDALFKCLNPSRFRIGHRLAIYGGTVNVNTRTHTGATTIRNLSVFIAGSGRRCEGGGGQGGD